MGASITLAGESLIAQRLAAKQTVNVARFVLANVPNLDPNTAVSRSAGKPPAAQIVGTYAVTQAGYVNPNQVVYSLMMGSDIGDFDFNWIGLETDNDVLLAVAYLPTQQKRRNIPPLQLGNNVTRNFMVVFDGAQQLTGVTIDASTWQHDFTVRLAGIDQRERLSNRDMFGRACFLGTALQLEKVGSDYRLKPGIAYVEGIRLELKAVQPVAVPTAPTTAWLDVLLQRELSDVVGTFRVVFGDDLVDYSDSLGVRHYLVPIAKIQSTAVITDLRAPEPIEGELIKHFAARVGDYPQLRARATTKADVGLDQIPNAISSAIVSDSGEVLATTRMVQAIRQALAESISLRLPLTGGAMTGPIESTSNLVIGINGRGWVYHDGNGFGMVNDQGNWAVQVLRNGGGVVIGGVLHGNGGGLTGIPLAGVSGLLSALETKANKATTLGGYGITDDLQWRTEPLTGKFTVECLDITQSGQESGVLIRTKIPADTTVMPHLTIKGCINGYMSPFEMQLSWYFYEGAFYVPSVFISGYYSPLGGGGMRVFLSHENGLVNIRLDFGGISYIPRLAITAYKSAGYGGNYAWYTGWTHGPWNRDVAIAGEMMAGSHTVLSTANIGAVFKSFVLAGGSARGMRTVLDLEAPGTLVETFSRTPPPATLKANGAAIWRASYPDLDAAIYVGDALNATAAWGYHCTDPGNPTGTRNPGGAYLVLPDARGEFRRGYDDGANRDSGREWASWQDQSIQGHTHSGFTTTAFLQAGAGGIGGPAAQGLTNATGAASVVGTSGVTRPRNINPLVCIRY
ncbi:phage tail protein [Pseudomonas sp. URMO17WK12:I2]|uniref:phage tail protein n=1 Tax=Pseudomonas sp. URMO17WK12:I2 TaxID=1261623 RepID=UPI000DAE87BC|nr:phage tail protein [Pseudomonas sp. URMO17WK12:I2]PZW49696.1 tail-collar fiber protein [Pseudomonas sp. URMO17WK12:I2]